MKLEEKVLHAFCQHHKSLSLAESCTGGAISDRLTNISGSSQYMKLAIVAYSNEAKINLLGVPQEQIKKHGAVSEQVAISMATGVRKIVHTDFGLAITGIAGPTGGSKRKPVGLTYIAVNTPAETLCLKCLFDGTRNQIKAQARKFALNLLLEFLE